MANCNYQRAAVPPLLLCLTRGELLVLFVLLLLLPYLQLCLTASLHLAPASISSFLLKVAFRPLQLGPLLLLELAPSATDWRVPPPAESAAASAPHILVQLHCLAIACFLLKVVAMAPTYQPLVLYHLVEFAPMPAVRDNL